MPPSLVLFIRTLFDVRTDDTIDHRDLMRGNRRMNLVVGDLASSSPTGAAPDGGANG